MNRVAAPETFETVHFSEVGALVLGRRMADLGIGPWGEEPTFHAPCLIGAVWQSRTALAATRAAARADDTEARRQLRRWSWGYRLIVLLLVAAAWDMTTKPGL